MQQNYPLAKTRGCCVAEGVKILFLACLSAVLTQQIALCAEGAAASKGQPTIEQLIKQVEAAPTNASSHVRLAERYEKLGYLSLAADQYEQATTCPNAPPEAFKYLAQLRLRTKMGKEAEAVAR